MTVDMSTYLPVSIQEFSPGIGERGEGAKRVQEAHFVWDEPISPQLLIPKP